MTDNTLHAAQLAEIIRWCKAVRDSQCKSFVDVALRHPEIWVPLRQDGFLRQILAQSLGWAQRINEEAIRTLSASELGAVLLNVGLDNAADFWVSNPSMCNKMHCAGKLDAALACVRSSLQPETEKVIPDSEVHELNGYGYLQAWLQLDLERAHENRPDVLDEALKELPIMPPQGWQTTGGRVADLADLIIARLLERAGIAFEAPGHVSAVKDVARYPDAFRLLRHHVIVRVCSTEAFHHGDATQTTLRIVRIDSGLIDSEALIIGYTHHVVESLRDIGVPVAFDKGFTYSSLVHPTAHAISP